MGSGDTWSFETVEESSSSDDSVNQEPDYDPDEFLFPPVPVVAAPVAPPVAPPVAAPISARVDGPPTVRVRKFPVNLARARPAAPAAPPAAPAAEPPAAPAAPAAPAPPAAPASLPARGTKRKSTDNSSAARIDEMTNFSDDGGLKKA